MDNGRGHRGHGLTGWVLVVFCIVGGVAWAARRSTNHTVVFFGRVLDEQGTPLPMVNVDALVLEDTTIIPVLWGGSRRETRVKATTDRDGNFVIHARGTDLAIHLTKLGYRVDERAGLRFGYMLTNETRLPDEKSPAIYYMKRRPPK